MPRSSARSSRWPTTSNMKVTAEGIENAEQIAQLAGLKCETDRASSSPNRCARKWPNNCFAMKQRDPTQRKRRPSLRAMHRS